MNTTDFSKIIEVINNYFKGTYEGDSTLLRKAFHEDAHITGIFQDTYHDWTLNEFIERVTTKPTATMKGEKYDKEIIFIDKTSSSAIVKARVLVNDIVFIDSIILLKIANEWKIRNKSFETL